MLCPGRSDLCLAPHPDSRVRLADWAIMIAVHAPCRRDICEGVEGGPFSGAGRVGKQVILQLRFRPGGTRRGRGQADLDLAESASSGQGVLGPCCGRIPSAWVRDQVRHCSRLNMLARRPMGTCSWLRVGLEIPRTKIRWGSRFARAGSDKPGCTQGEGDPPAPLTTHPFPLSCSCLFKKFVRGPDRREWARAWHAIWKEPHTCPRPFCRARPGASAGREGALSPKSFEERGVGARRDTADTVVSFRFSSPGLLSRDCHYCYRDFYFSAVLDPTLAHFTARMKLTRVGVRMVCSDEKKSSSRACGPTTPARKCTQT